MPKRIRRNRLTFLSASFSGYRRTPRNETNDVLARLARATGATKSELIRRAIERLLRPTEDDDRRLARFRRAVDAAAGRVPDLPEGRVYVEGLRRIESERQRELEARRSR